MDQKLLAAILETMPADPQLTPQDKGVLMELCQQGGPLWKILKSALDYANHMRNHIAACPLDTPEGCHEARQLQLKRDAALNFMKWLVTAIQGAPASLAGFNPTEDN
jgi:hypothetical protein